MKVTIDGREILVEGGGTLLEIARRAGIAIPSLCDHPDLEPFTGCRLCLVEIGGRKDLAPACGTEAEDGMVVRTRTPELVSLRKKILELILTEHPYACLVCAEKTTCDDQKSTIRKVAEVTGCVLCPVNGACDLQKTVEAAGLDKVDLPALYRNAEVRKEDPFFDRDPNLCILCGKCVRVCEEVRGASVLSFIHRGERTVVGTAFDRPLLDSGCRFCGACVDVCPTAALVDRAARPQPRAERSASIICAYCAQGCGLDLGLRNDKVVSVRPSAASPANRGQACVKGRFLVGPTHGSARRITGPLVRKDGRLVPVPFDEALDRAAAGLGEVEPDRRALVFPAQGPLEDAYLFLKFGREVLKTATVTTAAPGSVWPALASFSEAWGAGVSPCYEFTEIEMCRSLLAWDVDLPVDHPIAWLKVVKAVRRGANLVAAGSAAAGPLPQAVANLRIRPGAEAALGAALAAALLRAGGAPAVNDGLEDWRESLPKSAATSGNDRRAIAAAAKTLLAAGPAGILFDATLVRGESGPANLASLWNLALLLSARLFPLGLGANERGIFELERGLGRRSGGRSWEDVRRGLGSKALGALYLAGPIPDLEGLEPPFLLCQDTHWSANAERADVVLPAADFLETGGTWVNTEGRIQAFPAAAPCPGSARPDREILSALARRMGVQGFENPGRASILREIRARVPAFAGYEPAGGGDWAFFVRDENPGRPRFIPAVSRRTPRRRTGGPVLLKVRYLGDGLRGFDPIAGSKGYAKVRRPGRMFIHPADAGRLGIAEGDAVELAAASGSLEGVAFPAPAVFEGTAEITVAGSRPAEREWLDRGLLSVDVRRKR